MTSKRLIILGAGMLLQLCLPARAFPDEFPIAEYEKHVQRYLSSLENISVEVTTSDAAVDSKTFFFDDCSIISIPNYYRAKLKMRIVEENGSETVRNKWFLLRPEGFFMVEDKGGGQYLLKRAQRDVTSPFLIAESGTPFGAMIRPISIFNYPIIRQMKGEFSGRKLEPLDFRRIENGDKEGACYTFRTKNDINGGKGETEYELNSRWLLIRYTTRSGTQPVRLVEEFTYTFLGDRMLPMRSTTTRIVDGDVNPPKSAVTDYQNYSVYNGSLEDFNFRQFGLPEPGDFQTPEPSRLWLYLLGLAVFLLAVSIGIRWRLRRKPAVKALS